MKLTCKVKSYDDSCMSRIPFPVHYATDYHYIEFNLLHFHPLPVDFLFVNLFALA